MTSPLDQYLMEKTALFGISGEKARELAGSTAVQLGVAAGLAAAPAVAQKVMNAVTKRHSYNQMLDQNPDLSEARDDNPQQFNNFYNSFHRLNPEFARDPVVSGTYMRQMMAHPEGAGKVIVESLKGREGFSSPGFDAMRQGASAAAKSFPSAYGQAAAPGNPFAAQEQRIKGMELNQKERDLSQKQRNFEDDQRQQDMWRR